VKIIEKAESLSEEPYPVGCKKLSGTIENLWRVRIGNYRIIYLVEEKIKIIKVTKIGHRKDVYD
jgi:mRNA interferase RelE/StbE